VDRDSLADRFGASSAEPVHLADAIVVRLQRSGEPFYKAGPGVDEAADRLTGAAASPGDLCPQ
jgi:hypothetical protein